MQSPCYDNAAQALARSAVQLLSQHRLLLCPPVLHRHRPSQLNAIRTPTATWWRWTSRRAKCAGRPPQQYGGRTARPSSSPTPRGIHHQLVSLRHQVRRVLRHAEARARCCGFTMALPSSRRQPGGCNQGILFLDHPPASPSLHPTDGHPAPTAMAHPRATDTLRLAPRTSMTGPRVAFLLPLAAGPRRAFYRSSPTRAIRCTRRRAGNRRWLPKRGRGTRPRLG